MGGSVKFEDALAARLGIMQPSREKLVQFLAAHPARLSPGECHCCLLLRLRKQLPAA